MYAYIHDWPNFLVLIPSTTPFLAPSCNTLFKRPRESTDFPTFLSVFSNFLKILVFMLIGIIFRPLRLIILLARTRLLFWPRTRLSLWPSTAIKPQNMNMSVPLISTEPYSRSVTAWSMAHVSVKTAGTL